MITTILGIFFVCQYLILALLALLRKLLLSIAHYITQAMSWILYGLSLASVWLTDLFTRRRPLFGAIQNIQITNNTTSAHNLQEPISKDGNQPGKNGIPSDWVRIELCPTDEISELLLDNDDNDTGRTLNGVQNGEIGGWKEREQFVPTKAEIEQRIWTWMDTIDAWIRTGR
jgi:hypothetical protein